MRYVIGIDGGGTKTRLKIADIQGSVLTTFEDGALNINSLKRENVEYTLKRLIMSGITAIGGKLYECEALCMGIAGAGRKKEQTLFEEIIRNMGYNGSMIITDDAQIALYSGIGNKEGFIVISGTGSICYGRNNNGQTHRAGGWGHIIGDEGSGYYIGRSILTHVMKNHDGRGRDTLLTSMVCNYLMLECTEDLVQYVYRSGVGKKEIAALARFADTACQMGDGIAGAILREAAQELFNCAKAVIERLGFQNKTVIMALSGSALNKSEFLQREFLKLVNEMYPLIIPSFVKNDVAYGAVLMALEKIDVRMG